MSPALKSPEIPKENLTGFIAEKSNSTNALSTRNKLDYDYV